MRMKRTPRPRVRHCMLSTLGMETENYCEDSDYSYCYSGKLRSHKARIYNMFFLDIDNLMEHGSVEEKILLANGGVKTHCNYMKSRNCTIWLP
ncbi:UNVERIFIED_CONTAM: hypothetical protein PYX00_007171 [Menopon gallinae]|uniref:Uncharacterized protein n=1 Tax=Menopon gallinae TaxID=328185 RepID=A0AAW2HIR4_9NEOP